MTRSLNPPTISVPAPRVTTRATAAGSSAPSPALIRFVTDGLTATLDSYRAGQLPLHRFVWELTARIETLDQLPAPTRAVTRLRWITRGLAALHTELADAGRAPTADEENSLTVTLVSLRTALATLDPHNPIDPAGGARPAAVSVPAVPTPRCVA
jgi:hypothetical protein